MYRYSAPEPAALRACCFSQPGSKCCSTHLTTQVRISQYRMTSVCSSCPSPFQLAAPVFFFFSFFFFFFFFFNSFTDRV